MSDNTKIEWTATVNSDGSVTPGATWNPIRARLKGSDRWGYHCERVSHGCHHCYACTMNGRKLPAWGTGLEYTVPNREKVEIFLDEEELLKPLKWGCPRKVFVCSMTDLFADFVPDEMIDRVFAVMALRPQHTFQVLTKRAERMHAYCSDPQVAFRVTKQTDWIEVREQMLSVEWPLPQTWLGVSCENQEWADKRIPWLLRTPAAVRFVSAEPLLGPLDLKQYLEFETCGGGHRTRSERINWVIAGAESGHGARACDEQWVREIKDQCVNASVAFFYKQHAVNGRKIPTPELDGRKWMEFPEVQR